MQSEGLYKQNIVLNDIQLKNVFEYYPELNKKIKSLSGIIF